MKKENKHVNGMMLHIGHNGENYDAALLGDGNLLCSAIQGILDASLYEGCDKTAFGIATEILFAVAQCDKKNDGQIIKIIKSLQTEDNTTGE